MDQLINLVVNDGQTRYKLLRPIGKWGPAFTLPLYEAAILSPEDNNTYISLVALKIISNTQEDYFKMAFQDVKTSKVIQFNTKSIILPITKFFQANVNGVTYFGIVLPYDTTVTSLRSLLLSNPRFSGGMDEKMIALVLERALRALDAIHKTGKHHTRITADTVFYDLGAPTFYLAYAASLYERTPTPNLDDPRFRPTDRMLAWGLAPEVKHDESLEFVDVYETEKSDIWLIGILALELAYGRILVEDRRELLDIANYISSNPGGLTDTWEELRIKSAESAPGGDPMKLPIVLSVEQTRFSERFGSFLSRCLDAQPQNRASAEELVNEHEFLRVNVGKVETFSMAIANKSVRYEDIPDDMIEEIMSRLPIDSLFGVISVLGRNKRTHISNSHFTLANRRPPHGYILLLNFVDRQICRVLSHDFQQIRSFYSPVEERHFRTLVGSSNGLVCDIIFNILNKKVIKLWVTNPVLRESRSVPPPNLPINHKFFDIYDFGCIGESNSYKILRIVQHQEGDYGAEIFRSSNKSWETLNIPWPIYSHPSVLQLNHVSPLHLCERLDPLYFGGQFYWLAYDHQYQIFRAVVSFNLVEESFVIVKTFRLEQVTLASQAQLVLSGNSLLVVIKNPNGGYKVCPVNEDEHWTYHAQFHVTPPEIVNMDLYDHVGVLFHHVESLLQV